MENGWIKLWRKSLEKGWLENHKLWAFWCWCLMKATHKEYDHLVGYQKVHLMPGDFVFGLKATSKELKMSIQSIRTIVNFLKMSQNLTIKTTNKFSIISVVNWATYQGQDNEINTQTNKRLTNKQQTNNNKQEYKEHKEHKNINIYSSESDEIRLSTLLFSLIKERDPKAKEPNYQKWGLEIDRLIRIDKREPREVEDIVIWCQENDFWQNNILSTKSLRKQFTQLKLKKEKGEESPYGIYKNGKKVIWGADE